MVLYPANLDASTNTKHKRLNLDEANYLYCETQKSRCSY